MTKGKEGQYEVECLGCHKKFVVSGISGFIPEHPQEDEPIEAYKAFVPCPGSKMSGRPIKPVV
jgi:hypothetical protein